jgi:hypothetical protein
MEADLGLRNLVCLSLPNDTPAQGQQAMGPWENAQPVWAFL